MIQEIAIEKLKIHPQNVRKTYTGIEELAEEYLEDGIHLSEEGRALYAKAIASCLKYGKPGQVSGNSYYY